MGLTERASNKPTVDYRGVRSQHGRTDGNQ